MGRGLRIGVALAIAALLLTGCAAAAASGLAVLDLSPSSIEAGYSITVTATCGDNANPAYVSSPAFGSVTLTPDHAVLQRTVTVPKSAAAGVYTVTLACASGQRSSAKLTVLDGHGKPANGRGPDTGGGEMAASTGARLALTGGLLAIIAGAGLWVASVYRRRIAARG